ncbi:MAG: hydroxyectoine utilization dehydratase EutB [Acidisphaera sp.]|nr:hydroxyectoine utilization dehydratase EutB [Acidisphaera sp.]
MPLAAIEDARQRIAGQVLRTPMRHSLGLSRRCGAPVHLKLENRQTTGSFKLRGATNAVLKLPAAARARGLVTVSTGNHGRALSHAAAAQGVRCVVFMSSLVPANKVAAIRALGAEIRITGRSQDEAEEAAVRLARAEGLTLVPPFDAPEIIAGQGTIGLEILEDVPEAELVLVPLSGGGLAAGIAAAVKALRPQARVIGVSMARGAAMHASLAAGRPVPVEELPTLADSLGGGIGLANRYTFTMARDLLDEVVLLSEEEIAAGIRHAHAAEQQVVEGAGAVAIAALLAGKVTPRGPAVLVVSGGNIDPALHRRILEGAALSTPETRSA